MHASGPMGARPDTNLSVTIQGTGDRPPGARVLLWSGENAVRIVLDEGVRNLAECRG